jgi:hypothetical protein
MTITATPSQISYAGDGASLAFAIPFVFDTSADLKVIRTSSVGVPTELSTGFSITGGGGSTGTCTFTVAPAVGEKITVLDDPELTQPVDYTDNDAFAASTHEAALDRTERQVKRLHQRVNRSFRVADGDLSDGDDLLVPISSIRAGLFFAFDASGNPYASAGTGGGDSALRTDLANGVAGPGSLLVAIKRTAAEILAGVVPLNYNLAPYYLLRYVPASEHAAILDGTSVYDATTALQNCIDAACAVAQGRVPKVTLPSGLINVTFINCTNTRQVGTPQRDGLIIGGAGTFATLIKGSPGKNKAVIDISGCQDLQLRDLSITGVAGSVGVGVFTGAQVLLNQSHQQKFSKVYIAIPSDATANGGNGTVGFWNCGSEENTHISCYYEADRAAIFTASASAPFAYASPVNPLSASHSCGVNQLVGVSLKNLLVAAPTLTTVDVGSFHFQGYMLTAAGGVAHLVQGAFVASSIKAIVEQAATFLDVQGSVIESQYQVNFATANAGACIRLRATSGIEDSGFKVYLNQLATKQLFAADVATSSTAATTAIRGTTFETNLDKAYILNGDIQFTGTKMTYVLMNSTDVHFRAPGYQYDVYEDRHVLKIPRTQVALVGVASPAVLPLLKVVTPNVGVANQLGIGTTCEINGQLTASAANQNSWGARIQAFLPFFADYITAVITAGAAAGSVLSKAVQTAANFDISAVTLTNSIATNLMTVNLSVARTGNQDTAVVFCGEATLWTDKTSVGVTSMQLL